MSRKKKSKRIDNSLTELVAGVRIASMMTGGSTLSSYGTIAYSNNYSLITLNRIILTYLYCNNGIFQTAIQLPVQDAIRNGIEIESGEMDAENIEVVTSWLQDVGIWETILNTFTWSRLFGGGGVVINSNQDPEQPLNMRGLQNSPIAFYDVDRWELTANNRFRGGDIESVDNVEYFTWNGQKIHSSRVIPITGKRAPSYVRKSLQNWGMSEGERMIRDLNLYLKNGDVLYEILDEAKVDVYKIKGLANKLATAGGTTKIQNRVMAANQIKNYVNALVMDIEEEFEQKNMSFTGLAEVMRENRIGIASALRMPMTKLFGLSASGFNTGESDLENYNAMVESEVRFKMQGPLRELIDIGMMINFGYIPIYKIEFPPLRILSAKEEEDIKRSQHDRIMGLYDRGIIDSHEVGQLARKHGLTEISLKAEKGLLPPQPTPPAGAEIPGDVGMPI